MRASLDELLKELRSMPPAAFTSQAWSQANDKVKAYKAMIPLLTELGSEALKDRHWTQVTPRLPTASLCDSVSALPSFLSPTSLRGRTPLEARVLLLVTVLRESRYVFCWCWCAWCLPLPASGFWC